MIPADVDRILKALVIGQAAYADPPMLDDDDFDAEEAQWFHGYRKGAEDAIAGLRQLVEDGVLSIAVNE